MALPDLLIEKKRGEKRDRSSFQASSLAHMVFWVLCVCKFELTHFVMFAG
jgi:hypothetical protein